MLALCVCVYVGVCVCVPLVNKASAERQLVVFPRLDTLNAVTLQENAGGQAHACARAHYEAVGLNDIDSVPFSTYFPS